MTYYEYIRIRNALVHDYNNIDEEKIFSRITPFMALFHKYFTAIRAYINRIEKNTKKTHGKGKRNKHPLSQIIREELAP